MPRQVAHAAYAGATTSTRLRPPGNELDPRAVGWWRTVLALWTAGPVVTLAVLAVLIPSAAVGLGVPAVLLLVLGVAVAALAPPWWFRLHRWEYTATAVYVRAGFLWQTWRFAPLSRVQTVDTRRGPVQQWFGLASVRVTTASSKGPITVSGLDAQAAVDVAERLTEEIQATPGDAT